MRPIDADELRKKAEMRGHLSKNPMVTVHYMCVDVVEIDNAPTLDVEPVRRGEWKKTEDNGKESIECTACGAYWCYRVPSDIYLSDANYCPNCGAKMEAK